MPPGCTWTGELQQFGAHRDGCVFVNTPRSLGVCHCCIVRDRACMLPVVSVLLYVACRHIYAAFLILATHVFHTRSSSPEQFYQGMPTSLAHQGSPTTSTTSPMESPRAPQRSRPPCARRHTHHETTPCRSALPLACTFLPHRRLIPSAMPSANPSMPAYRATCVGPIDSSPAPVRAHHLRPRRAPFRPDQRSKPPPILGPAATGLRQA